MFFLSFTSKFKLKVQCHEEDKAVYFQYQFTLRTWAGKLKAEPLMVFMIASVALRALFATLMAPVTNVSGKMWTGGDGSFGSPCTQILALETIMEV